MTGNWTRLKERLIGRPIASEEHEHQLLPKFLALPVFSSDCLSSVAYATEEVVLVMALAGVAGFAFIGPVSIAIAALMAIVVTSAVPLVKAYPQGGGAFLVVHDNLGLRPAMVAAAALLTDYILTVAVSVSAGVAAITSALPSLLPYRVLLAIGFLVLLTLANLRGAKESGALFAGPTYAFIVIVMITLAVGMFRCLAGTCPQAVSAGSDLGTEIGAVSVLLILRAFASGASALTGVEAIADGVQAFRAPKARNAAITLVVMGVIAVTMFLGISTLARWFNVQVSEVTIDRYGTVLSQIGRAVFGTGAGFATLQIATMGILVLGANTAYQDFPRLSAILAGHRLMPRQFRNRGDRLVFSNGILVVSLLAGLLIVAFGAQVSRLIQLYVVGVFTSITLSQIGLVRHWLRSRGKGWRRSILFSSVGAIATGLVLVVAVFVKFIHGAWIVIVAIPLFVLGMAAMRRHYLWVASRLRQPEPVDCPPSTPHRVVVLASRSGKHLDRALRFARLLHADRLETWHVREAGDRRLRVHWQERHADLPLTLLEPDRDGIAATLRRKVRQVRALDPDTLLTVIVTEQVGHRRWRHFLSHRRGGAPSILWALRQETGVAVTDLNYHGAGHHLVGRREDPRLTLVSKRLVRMARTAPGFGRGLSGPLQRVEAVVMVSEVTAPTLRALRYACTISPGAVRALHVEIEPEQRARVEAAWSAQGIKVPLEVVASPFRDLTAAVLDYVDAAVRRAGEGTMIDVIIPEFVVTSFAGKLLHNQSALWIRAALYADTRVAVTSVPWVLEETPAQPAAT